MLQALCTRYDWTKLLIGELISLLKNYNKMKLSVSYASARSIVRYYEVLACVIETNNLPDSFSIVMKVKSKGCYTLRVYVTRSIEVSVFANAVNIQSLPKYSHCIKWRMHKLRYSLSLNDLS